MTKQEKSKLVKRLAESICALYEQADGAETCSDCDKGEKTQSPENLGEASNFKVNFANVQLGLEGKTMKVSSFRSVEDFLQALYQFSIESGEKGNYQSIQIDFEISEDDPNDNTYDVQVSEIEW